MNNETNKNNERVKGYEDLLNDPFYMQIPTNPTKDEIVEALTKNPAIISYLGTMISASEEELSKMKLILDSKKREYSNLVSGSRIDFLENYRRDLKTYLSQEPNMIKELAMETGCTAVQARDIIKIGRPEKPTSSDLNDRAEREHFDFYNKEILEYENKIVEQEKNINDLKVKLKLYENNLRAATSIKGLIEAEMRSH